MVHRPANLNRVVRDRTYMIDGLFFAHQDSLGVFGLITDGATQWIRPARAFLHIETPAPPNLWSNRPACSTAIQLWVNPACPAQGQVRGAEISGDLRRQVKFACRRTTVGRFWAASLPLIGGHQDHLRLDLRLPPAGPPARVGVAHRHRRIAAQQPAPNYLVASTDANRRPIKTGHRRSAARSRRWSGRHALPRRWRLRLSALASLPPTMAPPIRLAYASPHRRQVAPPGMFRRPFSASLIG